VTLDIDLTCRCHSYGTFVSKIMIARENYISVMFNLNYQKLKIRDQFKTLYKLFTHKLVIYPDYPSPS
jgi:hypothetical protein